MRFANRESHVLPPNFPDAFTMFDGDVQWRNPQTGHVAHDPTKILHVAAKRTPDLARSLSTVIDAGKTHSTSNR